MAEAAEESGVILLTSGAVEPEVTSSAGAVAKVGAATPTIVAGKPGITTASAAAVKGGAVQSTASAVKGGAVKTTLGAGPRAGVPAPAAILPAAGRRGGSNDPKAKSEAASAVAGSSGAIKSTIVAGKPGVTKRSGSNGSKAKSEAVSAVAGTSGAIKPTIVEGKPGVTKRSGSNDSKAKSVAVSAVAGTSGAIKSTIVAGEPGGTVIKSIIVAGVSGGSVPSGLGTVVGDAVVGGAVKGTDGWGRRASYVGPVVNRHFAVRWCGFLARTWSWCHTQGSRTRAGEHYRERGCCVNSGTSPQLHLLSRMRIGSSKWRIVRRSSRRSG